MARVPSGEGRIAAELAQLARAERAATPSTVAPSVSGGLAWTPAGGGQFIGGTPTNVPGGTSQPGAPRPATPQPTAPGDTPPGNNPPPNVPVVPVVDDTEARRARQNAADYFASILAQWGIGGLSGVINDLLLEFGTNAPDAIMMRIKQTEPYKQRFKGLLGLRQRGITDIPDEGSYLRLESQYRQVFREAGLRDYLGASGSQSEYDAIAKLVGDFSLSVDEVRDRVTDAQRVVADTPQEVRDSLQRFYNIDPATLTAYVLDPTRTTGEIQRRANAAIIGGYAQRAGLEFGAGISERIGEFLGGERDITGTQVEPQLTEIADIQRTTQRLAEIEQGTLSAETSALSALNLDREARERVRTLQSRERARFGGRSGITTGSLSAGPSV